MPRGSEPQLKRIIPENLPPKFGAEFQKTPGVGRLSASGEAFGQALLGEVWNAVNCCARVPVHVSCDTGERNPRPGNSCADAL